MSTVLLRVEFSVLILSSVSPVTLTLKERSWSSKRLRRCSPATSISSKKGESVRHGQKPSLTVVLSSSQLVLRPRCQLPPSPQPLTESEATSRE